MMETGDQRPAREPSLDAARQLVQAGRDELAVNELRALLALVPEHVEGHALLGIVLARMGRREGVEAGREAVRLAPEWAYPHAVLGETYLRLGRNREAVASARASLALDPANAGCWAVLSAALLNRAPRLRGRPALEAAEAGLALDPFHPDCARLRAQALLRMRRRAEAREAAAYALSLAPELSLMHEVAGRAEMAGGDRDRARRHIREALRLDPRNARAAWAMGDLGDLARLCAAMDAVLAGRGRWLWAAAGLFAAEVAAQAAWTDGEHLAFALVCAAVGAGAPAAGIAWVRRRHAALVTELRAPAGLSRRDRVEAWAVLLTFAGIPLAVPLAALLGL